MANPAHRVLRFVAAIAVVIVLNGEMSSTKAASCDVCSVTASGDNECDCALCRNSVWMSVDYLMWWTRGDSVPALVTTSPAGTPRAAAGVLGQPGTTTLFGGDKLNDDLRSGVRVRGGVWNDCNTKGLDFQFFALETKAARYQRGSNGDPILSRPFIDSNSNQPIAELAAYPGLLSGSVDANVTSNGLWGWGTNYRSVLSQCGTKCCGSRWDVAIGYRQLRMDDHIGIQERLTSPLFAQGTELVLNDQFATRNAFYGLNLGLNHQLRRSDWRLDSFLNVGLGGTSSRVRVQGDTTIMQSGVPVVTQTGGLLALQSNIGDYRHSDFSAIFDLGTNVGYRVRENLWLHVGYSLLFWPNVYRAGDQIDEQVNPNLLPPAAPQPGDVNRPIYPGRKTDFWAQGINIGIDYRY
ncbi:MAG: BBP7 family outer membrane beta-barrel protein [Planctomycetales bacterium]|nr:BBP7 family outer membrane beta-barrel protein [Planctomycetales bacterium]MCA9166042.1 BBP7 family outer membrane beta-barrel protein [Planctomycetales bacterium]